MPCCGKKIKNIIVGQTKRRLGISDNRSQDRTYACINCEQITYLGGKEYADWLIAHGVEILRNFTELEKLPPLPKHARSRKNPRRITPYCRLCKCCVEAKALILDEQCPIDEWSEADNLLKNPKAR